MSAFTTGTDNSIELQKSSVISGSNSIEGNSRLREDNIKTELSMK